MNEGMTKNDSTKINMIKFQKLNIDLGIGKWL